jgi:hypothetical protein
MDPFDIYCTVRFIFATKCSESNHTCRFVEDNLALQHAIPVVFIRFIHMSVLSIMPLPAVPLSCLRKQLFKNIRNSGEIDWSERANLPGISPPEFGAFVFDEKDVAFQTNVKLVGPISEDGCPRFPQAGDNKLPLLDIEEADIRGIGARCRVEDKFGEVCDANSNVICVVGDSCAYLIAHATCLHLLHSFSRLTTFQLWDLFRTTNLAFPVPPLTTLIERVDYLEIQRSISVFFDPFFGLKDPAVRKSLSRVQLSMDPPRTLRSLLLKDAEMWVFIAPDRCAGMRVYMPYPIQ